MATKTPVKPAQTPEQIELQRLDGQIEELNAQINEFANAATVIDVKLQTLYAQDSLPAGATVSASGGIFDELHSHLEQRQLHQDSQAQIVALQAERGVAVERLEALRSQLHQIEQQRQIAQTKVDAISLLPVYADLYDRYSLAIASLNAVAGEIQEFAQQHGRTINAAYPANGGQPKFMPTPRQIEFSNEQSSALPCPGKTFTAAGNTGSGVLEFRDSVPGQFYTRFA